MKKPTKQSYRIRNWREYNRALINRGSLTLWIDESAATAWYNLELSGSRGASDYYSDVAILCVLTLKEVFHLPLRGTQGLVESLVQLMDLSLDVPDYTTLGRRRKRLEVPLAAKTNGGGLHVLVDSTGMKVYGEGEWKVRQHGISKRRTWRKLHLGVDGDTQQIVAAVVTTNDVSDDEAFGALIDQIDEPIERVNGDGGYDKRKVYEKIIERGADAVIPPRRGAKIWKHGNAKGDPHPRDGNLRAIRSQGRAQWKRASGYHERSLVETAIYRIKTIFGDKLGARLFESQAAELLIKCAAINKMSSLGMPDSYAVT